METFNTWTFLDIIFNNKDEGGTVIKAVALYVMTEITPLLMMLGGHILQGWGGKLGEDNTCAHT